MPISPTLPKTRQHAKSPADNPEARIAAIAGRYHGIIDAADAVAAGFTRAQMRNRVARSLWHVIHTDVFLLGHGKLSRTARIAAAVAAAGRDCSAATGWSVLELHRMDRFGTRHPPEVVTTRRQRPIHGVRVRMTSRLHRRDVRTVQRIRCTSVARALIDIADDATPFLLAGIMYEAEYRGLLDMRRLRELASEFRNRRGHASLVAAIALRDSGSQGVKSLLEERAVMALIAAGIRCPEINVILYPSGGDFVLPDLLWRDERVVLEVDGGGHARHKARVRDSVNRARLEAAGYLVIRASEHRIKHDMDSIIAEVRAALADRAGRVFISDLGTEE